MTHTPAPQTPAITSLLHHPKITNSPFKPKGYFSLTFSIILFGLAINSNSQTIISQ